MAGNGNAAPNLTPGSTGYAGLAVTYHVKTAAGATLMLPMRGLSGGVDTVRSLIGGRVNPDLPMFTCRVNGATVVVTLRDLKLAP